MTSRTTTLTSFGAASALTISLAGCAPAVPDDQPNPDTSTSAPAAELSAQERFDMQSELVTARYPLASAAGDFTGDESTTIEVNAAGEGADAQIAFVLTCTGEGEYTVTVEQENPNEIRSTCGTDGTGIAAVPLDDPTAPMELSVSVPDGSTYWLTTYYIGAER